VIDAEVSADADQPRLEVRAAVERVERPEQLEKHVLGKILRQVVPPDELVRDAEDGSPVQAHDFDPRVLIAVEAAFDDLVDRAGRCRRGVSGHCSSPSRRRARWGPRIAGVKGDRDQVSPRVSAIPGA
jgi:hypothetical protein